MSFHLVKQEKALVGGVLHQVWLIEEVASGPFDVWQLHVPPFFTVTLFEVELLEEGEATTLQPMLGLGEQAIENSLSEVVVSNHKGRHLRFEASIRVTAMDVEGLQCLCGRSRPDGVAGRIRTRLTIQHGHRC